MMDTIQQCCHWQEKIQHDDFIKAAAEHCRLRGVRMTRGRRLILQLVLARPGVVKAYDLLNDLKKLRGKADPPTVYRALEFFVEHGLMHRVEGMNGFVLCRHFCHAHESILLCCEKCHRVEELPLVEGFASIKELCARYNFSLNSTLIMLNGYCQQCDVDEENANTVEEKY